MPRKQLLAYLEQQQQQTAAKKQKYQDKNIFRAALCGCWHGTVATQEKRLLLFKIKYCPNCIVTFIILF